MLLPTSMRHRCCHRFACYVKVILRLVARCGDACNVGGGDPETIRHKLLIIQARCVRKGRIDHEIVRELGT